MLRAYIEAPGDDIFFVADKSDQFARSALPRGGDQLWQTSR